MCRWCGKEFDLAVAPRKPVPPKPRRVQNADTWYQQGYEEGMNEFPLNFREPTEVPDQFCGVFAQGWEDGSGTRELREAGIIEPESWEGDDGSNPF